MGLIDGRRGLQTYTDKYGIYWIYFKIDFDSIHAHWNKARAESSGVIKTPIGKPSNGKYEMALHYSLESGQVPLSH